MAATEGIVAEAMTVVEADAEELRVELVGALEECRRRSQAQDSIDDPRVVPPRSRRYVGLPPWAIKWHSPQITQPGTNLDRDDD